MSCGCKSAPQANPHRRTNAAMCAVCPSRKVDIVGATACAAGPKPVPLTWEGLGACPRGRHTKNGIVRWWGIHWYGVPAPLRWMIIGRGVVKLNGPLPGCGCLVRLRSITDRLGLTPLVERLTEELRAATISILSRSKNAT